MSADRLADAVTFRAAVGAGVIGGVFYGFSTFVMRAVRGLPAREGMAAMRAINVAVINPWFLGAFVGTAVTCVVAAVLAWGRAGGRWVQAGAGLYEVGTFGVTGVFNVPLNEALAKAEAGEAFWGDYVRRWVAWNHVRTAAAVGAMGAMIAGLRG
jgi:uncharacterized membrane protein